MQVNEGMMQGDGKEYEDKDLLKEGWRVIMRRIGCSTWALNDASTQRVVTVCIVCS